ncbi:MAG: hypothetical protein D6705_07415 [Deltaproteobacteria bacterium]|nr:MAG: hypothetical protein D6705_07415 [Deltaproteobacteria bacterium]
MDHRPPKDGKRGAKEALPARHLVVVPPRADATADATARLAAFVRSARRDTARLLRALQRSGRPVGTLPDDVLSRLAHLDAVTARFLQRGDGDRAAVEDAAVGLRATERWIVAHLSPSERAEVRLHTLQTYLSDEDVLGPLVHVDLRGGSHDEGPRTLRAGLRALSPARREAVARRLGVRCLRASDDHAGAAESFVEAVAACLLDGHLLGVLVATFSPGAHHLLARIVRQGQVPIAPNRAARPEVGELVETALVFAEPEDAPASLWVPVDLHRRIDGVLRALVPAG